MSFSQVGDIHSTFFLRTNQERTKGVLFIEMGPKAVTSCFLASIRKIIKWIIWPTHIIQIVKVDNPFYRLLFLFRHLFWSCLWSGMAPRLDPKRMLCISKRSDMCSIYDDQSNWEDFYRPFNETVRKSSLTWHWIRFGAKSGYGFDLDFLIIFSCVSYRRRHHGLVGESIILRPIYFSALPYLQVGRRTLDFRSNMQKCYSCKILVSNY